MFDCKICGKEFEKKTSMAAHTIVHSDDAIKKRNNKVKELVDSYNLNPNKCLCCGIDIIHISGKLYNTTRKTFCGHSCSTIFLNRKKGLIAKKNMERACGFCGVMFKNKGTNTVCCSGKCSGLLRSLNAENKYRKLIEDGHQGPLKMAGIKNVLLKDRGHKCELCNNSEWMGHVIPIEVHHIDGDSCNFRGENLQLICPNCHAQTDNYKSKNKNATRKR